MLPCNCPVAHVCHPNAASNGPTLAGHARAAATLIECYLCIGVTSLIACKTIGVGGTRQEVCTVELLCPNLDDWQ